MNESTTGTPVPIWQEYTHKMGPAGTWVRVPVTHDVPLADPVRSTVPDAFTATVSTKKTGRANSGRTTVRIIRHGRAVVTGSIDLDEYGRPAHGSHLMNPTARRDRMNRIIAGPVHLWADQWAAAHGVDLPRLTGTDCMSWEQVIRAGDGETVRAETWTNPGDPVTAAIRAGYLTLEAVTVPDIIAGDHPADTARAALLVDLRDPAGKYGTARPVTRWPVRTALGMGRGIRAGDPVDVVTGRAETYGPGWIVRLVAPGPDSETRFVGFVKVNRPGTVRTARKERATVTRVPVEALPGRPSVSRLIAVAGSLGNGRAVHLEWTGPDGTRHDTRVSRAATGTGIPGAWTVTVHRTTDGTRVRTVNRTGIRSARTVARLIDRATV